MRDEILDKILAKVIELQENGKNSEEILAMFPEAKNEIQETFDIIQMLKKEKSEMSPSREFFKKTLAKANSQEFVTEKETVRYINRDEQGRSSGLINNLMEKLMNSKLKIALPAMGIIIVAAIVSYGLAKTNIQNSGKNIISLSADEKKSNQEAGNQVQKTAQDVKTELPKATGNANATVDAIVASISAEQASMEEEFKDAELISADNDAINNFFQTYDEDSI